MKIQNRVGKSFWSLSAARARGPTSQKIDEPPEPLWLASRSVAAILAGVFGWYDPSHYFGGIPPEFRSLGMVIATPFLVGWCLKAPAEAKQVSELRGFLVGMVTAFAVSLLIIAAGDSRGWVWAGAYAGFLGGFAAMIYPRWALGGAVAGLIIGAADVLIDSRVDEFRQRSVEVIRTSIMFALFLPFLWATKFNIHGKRPE